MFKVTGSPNGGRATRMRAGSQQEERDQDDHPLHGAHE